MSNPDDFFGGGGAPSFKFAHPGDVVEGEIVDMVVTQSIDFDSKNPLWWKENPKDGTVASATEPHPGARPKEQLNVTLQTDLRDPAIEDDDGERRVYFDGKRINGAAKKALREAKAKQMDVGGWLRVAFTGYDPTSKVAKNPAKEWLVEYRVPSPGTASGGFFASPAATTEAAPAATPPAAAPAPSSTPDGAADGPPPGVDPTVWAGLPADARAAMKSLVSGGAAVPA